MWLDIFSCDIPAAFLTMLDELVHMKPSSPRSSCRELVITDWNADRDASLSAFLVLWAEQYQCDLE